MNEFVFVWPFMAKGQHYCSHSVSNDNIKYEIDFNHSMGRHREIDVVHVTTTMMLKGNKELIFQCCAS